MKRKIAIEIETSDDGKYCSFECCFLRPVYNRPSECSYWMVDIQQTKIGFKRAPACLKAEVKNG